MEIEKFSLAYKTINGVTAIWFEFAHRDWIVDPCGLLNVGIDKTINTPLLYLTTKHLSQRMASYYVKQEFCGDYFAWEIEQLLSDHSCVVRFNYCEFLKKIEESLCKLYKDTTEQKATAYDGIIDQKELEKINEQFKLSKFLYLPGVMHSSEVKVEKLQFDCPAIEDVERKWSIDIPYVLSIGNRQIISYITDFSNNIDYVRYQLELYCYRRKARIELNYEDEPTIINLQHISTLASVRKLGNGIAYDYDHYVKVEILPNSFVKGAAIVGICNEQDTIKELYEGLLNIGRVGYEYDKNSIYNAWDYEPIVFYNKIKSPLIERYISGIEEKHDSISERQRIIHYVFTICPDYIHILGNVTGQICDVEIYADDIITLYKSDEEDDELCTIHLPGIYAWLDEFNCHSDGCNSTMGTMDTIDWHRRGLVLAKELKKKLPDDVDVWYGYPFEDVEHRYCRPILITDDV